MPRTKKITGVVVYKNIGTGFWGVEEFDGTQWLPVNLPRSYQQEGKRITAKIREMRDAVNIHMWGTPMKIVAMD